MPALRCWEVLYHCAGHQSHLLLALPHWRREHSGWRRIIFVLPSVSLWAVHACPWIHCLRQLPPGLLFWQLLLLNWLEQLQLFAMHSVPRGELHKLNGGKCLLAVP